MRAKRAPNAISFQIAIRGRGIRKMKKAALTELVNRRIEGQPIPQGVEVRVQCWARGQEVDWEANNSRAQVLRDTLWRAVQQGRVRLSVRDDGEPDEA